MVDIVEAYQKLFAGKMYPSQLLRALQGEDPDIKVKGVSNSVIMFSNGELLKCTNSYYENLEGKQPALCTNNGFVSCRQVRACLGLRDIVNDVDCVECHIQCLKLLQAHKIKRKKRKQRRRKIL